MGERRAKPPLVLPVARVQPTKPAPLPKATGSTAPRAEAAASACAPDEQRLRNYAGRMVEGLGIGPTDDLKLFEPDGTPAANLTPVMLAMSKVELGLFSASPELVERAIGRALAKIEAEAKTDPPPPPAP